MKKKIKIKMLSNKVKGHLSLISVTLINPFERNLLTFSNIIQYYHSYLYYKQDNNEKIPVVQLYFFVSI